MITFIVVGGVLALVRFAKKKDNAYVRYRVVLARTIQVGLELLVAADIIRTVSIPLTAVNLAFAEWLSGRGRSGMDPYRRDRGPLALAGK